MQDKTDAEEECGEKVTSDHNLSRVIGKKQVSVTIL